jgi:hypothetical protein
MNRNVKQLGKRIEEVVHGHLEACRREAEAAVVRALGAGNGARRSSPARLLAKRAKHRSTTELSVLREQLYDVVLANPGETMAVLARALGSSGSVLQFPMRQLRQLKKVRSGGAGVSTRYFPMAVGKSA